MEAHVNARLMAVQFQREHPDLAALLLTDMERVYLQSQIDRCHLILDALDVPKSVRDVELDLESRIVYLATRFAGKKRVEEILEELNHVQ